MCGAVSGNTLGMSDARQCFAELMLACKCCLVGGRGKRRMACHTVTGETNRCYLRVYSEAVFVGFAFKCSVPL